MTSYHDTSGLFMKRGQKANAPMVGAVVHSINAWTLKFGLGHKWRRSSFHDLTTTAFSFVYT
jgi:hypothetical protein